MLRYELDDDDDLDEDDEDDFDEDADEEEDEEGDDEEEETWQVTDLPACGSGRLLLTSRDNLPRLAAISSSTKLEQTWPAPRPDGLRPFERP